VKSELFGELKQELTQEEATEIIIIIIIIVPDLGLFLRFKNKG
jgi:hypothetical protein